jgi:hypothetical protein
MARSPRRRGRKRCADAEGVANDFAGAELLAALRSSSIGRTPSHDRQQVGKAVVHPLLDDPLARHVDRDAVLERHFRRLVDRRLERVDWGHIDRYVAFDLAAGRVPELLAASVRAARALP